jgi:hypothetical protein
MKGEVIVEKMVFFEYIIKKLFNNIGDGIN